jgi:DnaK suppressor protein
MKESGMKKKELDTFKEMLLDEKKKILHHLEDISSSAGKDDINLNAGDPVDIASLEITHASMQRMGKRELFLLKKIDLALKKIDDGSYGVCESCGEMINIKRLHARPVAQLCIDCKTDQENLERRYSSKEQSSSDDDGFFEESEEY